MTAYLGPDARLTPTRAALADYPVVGNAYHDGPLSRALDHLIADDTQPMADRIWALDHLSAEVMGLDEPAATEQDVADYVASR